MSPTLNLRSKRQAFLKRRNIPNWKIEILVYVYCLALYAIVPIAALVFWQDFAINPVLTLIVASAVAAAIYLKLRRS